MTSTGLRDNLGVDILVGDRVMVTSWGGRIRLNDVRRVVVVRGRTPRGNLRHDCIAPGDLATLPPGYVQVMRRDGTRGFEGNHPDRIQDRRP